MQLSLHADYSCRVLIYLAIQDSTYIASIKEIASAFSISENHLMKVVHKLSKLGFIHSIRGRSGGIQLGKAPHEIRLRDVVSAMEPNFQLVECFDASKNNCRITPACQLKIIFTRAREAFLRELETVTIADLIHNKGELTDLLQPTQEKP